MRELFIPLEPQVQYKVISMTGQFVLDVIEGVLEIQAEIHSGNNATDEIPATWPHELAKIRGREFGDILLTYIDRLRRFLTEESISNIEHQHRGLVFAYQNEPALKSALDQCDHNTSFQVAWTIVEGWFNALRDFCGGIATIFANTATVESDFSVLGWEKDEYRMSLTDISLEGIMQCKQFNLLSRLA